MVERRDAQETIILSGVVMHCLHLRCLVQRQMLVQNRLREACGPRREIDCSVILIRQRNPGGGAGIIRYQISVILRKIRAAVPDIKQQTAHPDSIHIQLQTLNEFRSEEQDTHLRQVQAVGDLI